MKIQMLSLWYRNKSSKVLKYRQHLYYSKKESYVMPWKLKYEKDDDMVALDFETKNQLDDYIKSNNLEHAWKVVEQIKAVVPADKE